MTANADSQASTFLPPVTFTDAIEARETYFALAEKSQALTALTIAQATDDAVSAEAFAATHQRAVMLNRLATLVFGEWERLQQAGNVPPW